MYNIQVTSKFKSNLIQHFFRSDLYLQTWMQQSWDTFDKYYSKSNNSFFMQQLLFYILLVVYNIFNIIERKNDSNLFFKMLKNSERFIARTQLLILWEFFHMKQIYFKILMIMIYLLKISTNSKNQLIRMSTKTILKRNQLRLTAFHSSNDFQRHRKSVDQSYFKWQLMFHQFLQ